MYRKRPDEKCPICDYNLLPKPRVNKVLNELNANCVDVLEILVEDIEMEEEPFVRGGFSKVYMAKWREENVVVKVITAKTEKEKQNVKCEANLTLRLSHRNVIRLFGITYVKQKKHSVKIGIVMEKAEHGSLDNWIGKIDQGKMQMIALGIIDGLEYVHSQKVMHRDLKPKNILMCGPENDMIPKIADFGVSKVIQTFRLTHTSNVGDLLYIAPEVLSKKKSVKYAMYGFTADIYSLAVTLFEMFNELSIERDQDDVTDFLLDVQGGNVAEIPQSSKVPMQLRNIIQRGWNNNPKDRPTLSEYRSALSGKIYLVHLPVLFVHMHVAFEHLRRPVWKYFIP